MSESVNETASATPEASVTISPVIAALPPLDTIKNKLASRKFWVILAYGFVALFSEGLGLDIDPDQLEKVGYAVMTYLGAQGAVDWIKNFTQR